MVKDGQGAERLPLFPELGVAGSQGAGSFSPAVSLARASLCWLGGSPCLEEALLCTSTRHLAAPWLSGWL